MRGIKVKVNAKESSKLSKKNINNIKKKDENLIFYTDESGIKDLISEIENIEYENILKKRIKYFFQKHLITVIALIIIVILLINQSVAITEIRFINYNTYDENVQSFLENKLKKVGPFYYLDDSLNNINFEIKSEFYDYEWISITKNGAYLDVDIKKQKVPGFEDVDDGIVGDYIASRDAIIKAYYVKKGIIFIYESLYVSKGDLLVSGNLKYHLNEIEYIKPQAIIIGEVLEYKSIKVEKNITRTERNGNLIIKNHLSLFNKPVFSKSPNETETEKKDVLNILDFIKIQKSYYYEVEEVKINYNYDEAFTYAKSLIRKEFPDNDYEKIIFMKLVSYTEDDNYYDFKFIVKKHENIAQFVPYNQE